MKQTIFLILTAIVVIFLYITIYLYVGNSDLIHKTIIGTYPLVYKIAIVQGLYSGLPNPFLPVDFLLFSTITILTGINAALVTKQLLLLLCLGKVHAVIGGSAGIGLAVSGCSSCGISFLAFFGLSSSLALLPLKGQELSLIVIICLLFSIGVLLRNMKKKLACKKH